MPEATAIFSVEAAGEVDNRASEFVYLEENVNHNADLSVKVDRRKRTAHRAHHSFLARCIGWRKNNRAVHPSSYLDTLMKTRIESIEAVMRRRRVLLAGMVAHMKDTRLPKCVMFGELVGGAGCVGGQRREWMGCLLNDLRAFGINADQWTTSAQDDGERRKAVEQGEERFMAKWIAVEKAKAGLWHVVFVVCPNVTGRTRERIVIAQSKSARAGSLAKVD